MPPFFDRTVRSSKARTPAVLGGALRYSAAPARPSVAPELLRDRAGDLRLPPPCKSVASRLYARPTSRLIERVHQSTLNLQIRAVWVILPVTIGLHASAFATPSGSKLFALVLERGAARDDFKLRQL